MKQAQNCLLTGVSTGLGRSLAACYHAQQWHVYGVDHQVPSHEFLESFLECDLAQFEAVNRLCDQLETLPSLHTCIMNAAAYQFTPFSAISMDTMRRIMQINTWSHCQLLQALMATHHAKSLKHIIVIGSDQVFEAKDYNCAYAMSKAALMQMVRAFACEYTQPKIIGLCPHTIAQTQITYQAAQGIAAIENQSVENVLSSFDDESPTGKMIDPDDLAHYIYNMDSTSELASGSVIELTPEMLV